MKLYLAGPMRGYTQFNFPAFDAYRDKLEKAGHDVISPADLDRAEGFNPNKDLETQNFTREECIKRDINAICEVDGLALMPGWEKSSGSMVEVATAMFLDKPCYELKPIGETPY